MSSGGIGRGPSQTGAKAAGLPSLHEGGGREGRSSCRSQCDLSFRSAFVKRHRFPVGFPSGNGLRGYLAATSVSGHFSYAEGVPLLPHSSRRKCLRNARTSTILPKKAMGTWVYVCTYVQCMVRLFRRTSRNDLIPNQVFPGLLFCCYPGGLCQSLPGPS